LPEQARSRCGDHAGVEVAGAFGVDLDDGHADGLHALGVDRAGDVALDDGRVEAAGEPGLAEKGLEERGFAAAGRADEIDGEHAGCVESRAVLRGQLLVGLEDLFGGDDLH
jgi:hypothetical protein